MKVLWLINVVLPEVSQLMGDPIIPYGGWLVGLSTYLAKKSDISLTIIFPKYGIDKIKYIKGEKINYYSFPPTTATEISKNRYFQRILNIEKPSIVHIFGTEYLHTLSMVNVCKRNSIKVLISIQGLVSVCAKHFTNGIPFLQIGKSTFYDHVRKNSIYHQMKQFEQMGNYEIKAIKAVEYISGRTDWDKACIQFMNRNINYYHCDEMLRENFYRGNWSYNKCKKHTILVSQASYPLKGFHYVIEAMVHIVEKFPDTVLYVSGRDIVNVRNLTDKIKQTSYGQYLGKLINKNVLRKHICFLGELDENEMYKAYLSANVFVSASTIENSPNSVCEAMLLGTPIVSSDVGGVSSLLNHKLEGFLYPADEPYMLAYYVMQIFELKKAVEVISKCAQKRARKRHNKDEILKGLLDIYCTMKGDLKIDL